METQNLASPHPTPQMTRTTKKELAPPNAGITRYSDEENCPAGSRSWRSAGAWRVQSARAHRNACKANRNAGAGFAYPNPITRAHADAHHRARAHPHGCSPARQRANTHARPRAHAVARRQHAHHHAQGWAKVERWNTLHRQRCGRDIRHFVGARSSCLDAFARCAGSG